jgi:hypothetical protein
LQILILSLSLSTLFEKKRKKKKKKKKMGVAVVGTDSLSERAAKMRESLQKSQTITDNVVSILGSFDHRLSVLEAAMRPTQVRRLTIFLFGSRERH